MKLKTTALIAVITVVTFTNTYAKDGKFETQRGLNSSVIQNQDFTPGLRINGYAFYAFDDKVDSYYSNTEYYNGTIKGGFQWGGGLEYQMTPGQSVELSYLRLDTDAPITYYKNGIQYTNFDVATNYVMIGGNRYFPVSNKIEPFAGLQAGIAIFNINNPDNGNSNNATKFAWGLKAGLNLWATSKFGIKIQTGLLSAVQAVGGGLYFGSGGAGAGVNTYSTFFQFYIGGGFTLNLAK